MELETSFRRLARGAVIVAPKGSIDSLTSIEFDGVLQTLLGEQPSEVLLDMGGVQYISSSGLGVLFKFKKSFDSRNLRFALYDPPLSVQRVLEISRASDLMQLRPEALTPESPFYPFVSEREELKKRLAEERAAAEPAPQRKSRRK